MYVYIYIYIYTYILYHYYRITTVPAEEDGPPAQVGGRAGALWPVAHRRGARGRVEGQGGHEEGAEAREP